MKGNWPPDFKNLDSLSNLFKDLIKRLVHININEFLSNVYQIYILKNVNIKKMLDP
jgi:hypothetical protein